MTNSTKQLLDALGALFFACVFIVALFMFHMTFAFAALLAAGAFLVSWIINVRVGNGVDDNAELWWLLLLLTAISVIAFVFAFVAVL